MPRFLVTYTPYPLVPAVRTTRTPPIPHRLRPASSPVLTTGIIVTRIASRSVGTIRPPPVLTHRCP